MPFTASKTAACTMAATREVTGGDVPPTSAARSIVWFQSVISSAPAVPAVRATTNNTGTHLYIVLIAYLLCKRDRSCRLINAGDNAASALLLSRNLAGES